MSNLRIKERISALVGNQLPEFVRTDYTTFVSFLEYYYRFLEQDQGALEIVQNARQYNDIDQTATSFINYFLNNYAKDIPFNTLSDKSLLVKRIGDLYASKGSNISFETLFRVLYNTSSLTRHPYDYVLRPSDGRWDTKVSLRVFKISGSVSDIQDRVLKLVKNNVEYSASIVRVKNLTTNLYEFFYKTRQVIPFEIGDTVTVSDNSTVLFTGEIRPTTTSYAVSVPGTGFRVGQVFNVSVGGAVDTLVRISKVTSVGGIETLRILNYGYNFTEDVTIVLANDLSVAPRTKLFNTKSGGFSEAFSLYKPATLSDPGRYFDTDYVADLSYTGTLEASIITDSTTTSVTDTDFVDPSNAVISFFLGAIARYPGQYTSTQGFLSEPDVRLQDGGLYQPFAYQVESELDASVFYDLVKKLIHPAGTNMYVNRVLAATANLASSVEVETRKNVNTQLSETISIIEDALIKNVGKLLVDTTNTLVDTATKSTTKVLSDSQTLNDSNVTLSVTKALTDQATVLDTLTYELNLVLQDSFTATDEITNIGFEYVRSFDSNTAVIDEGVFLESEKPLFDDVSITDASDVSLQLEPTFDTVGVQEVLTTQFSSVKDETVSLTEEQFISFTKAINNTDSTVTITDNGDVTLLNYAEEGYFADVYAGTSTPF